MNHFGADGERAVSVRSASAGGEAARDAELVDAARRGDKGAFVEIVARHQAMVCGIALGILGDFAASEDAGQEAFLTAWRKIHELREPERLRAWLGQIARHAALGQLRRRRVHDPIERAAELPDAAPPPDERAATEDEAALVRAALAKLPESCRLPLILFYREGQSVRAVAGALGLSEDAVKQRLARGREMLRERMAGLVEEVLSRTRPNSIFTMSVAAAIGALAAPAAVAGGVFHAALAAGNATGAPASGSLLGLLGGSKSMLLLAAFTAMLCVPIGYHVRAKMAASAAPVRLTAEVISQTATPDQETPADAATSAIFAEWKRLHDTHGHTAEAMPRIYGEIARMADPLRRRAFRTALIAEWAQLDPTNGLSFFLQRVNDASQRRQFFAEWLARDADSAVAALPGAGAGWEAVARGALPEMARRAPRRVAEVVAALPSAGRFQDAQVRDAFAAAARADFAAARAAAERLAGPNRTDALAGVAQTWGRDDVEAALAWAEKLPGETGRQDRHEVMRGALLGRAAADPASALEKIARVPPGGRPGYAASTTGARVLREAARADFDATTAWLAANPARLGAEDLAGLAAAVAEKLNDDAVSFLNRHFLLGSLAVLLPAVALALENEGAAQRPAVRDWLRTQPADAVTRELGRLVAASAEAGGSAR